MATVKSSYPMSFPFDMGKAEMIINALNPAGFLRKVGEAMDCDVRLGDNVEAFKQHFQYRGVARTKIRVNVVASGLPDHLSGEESTNSTIGVYQISIYDHGRGTYVHYIGPHPSYQNEQKHVVSAATRRGFVRQDGWSSEIAFPGALK